MSPVALTKELANFIYVKLTMSKGSSVVIRPETVLRGHKDSVNCVGFLTDEVLASGSVDGVLKLWSTSSRRAILSIQAHKESVLSVETEVSSIITCGRDGFAKLWQIDHESIASIDSTALSFQTGAKHFCNASCDRGYNSGN
jgi:WD40 repeat protein